MQKFQLSPAVGAPKLNPVAAAVVAGAPKPVPKPAIFKDVRHENDSRYTN